jgi:hypothetical protein
MGMCVCVGGGGVTRDPAAACYPRVLLSAPLASSSTLTAQYTSSWMPQCVDTARTPPVPAAAGALSAVCAQPNTVLGACAEGTLGHTTARDTAGTHSSRAQPRTLT